MDTWERAAKIIEQKQGIARTLDFAREGLSSYDISTLCKKGYIERIRQGYYLLSEKEPVQEEQLLASLLPEGIVCVESALFHYGYSDFIPRQWSIAVPRTFSRTRLDSAPLPLKPYFIQPSLFHLGKTSGLFNGIRLAVYDRERTLCDCFKYRAKLDQELFSKALRAYAADERKNLTRLTACAKALRVHKKVMEVMEVLLDG